MLRSVNLTAPLRQVQCENPCCEFVENVSNICFREWSRTQEKEEEEHRREKSQKINKRGGKK